MTGFDSESASKCSGVCTTWLLDTCVLSLPTRLTVSGVPGGLYLRSADRGHRDFPRVRLATYGGRAFAYAGPSDWNSLPADLRDNRFLSQLSNAILRPFSSLSISTRSSFGVLLQKTRYINSQLLKHLAFSEHKIHRYFMTLVVLMTLYRSGYWRLRDPSCGKQRATFKGRSERAWSSVPTSRQLPASTRKAKDNIRSRTRPSRTRSRSK